MTNAPASQQPDTFAPEIVAAPATAEVEYLVMERVEGGAWNTIGEDRPFTSREWAERSLRMQREYQAEHGPEVEVGLFVRENGALRRA